MAERKVLEVLRVSTGLFALAEYAKAGGWESVQQFADEFCEQIPDLEKLWWPTEGSESTHHVEVEPLNNKVPLSLNIAQRLYTESVACYRDHHGDTYVLWTDFQKSML